MKNITINSNYRRLLTGGALVESLLILGVLVTFMLGIPMMGTIFDLKQKTIEASRYAAWEKTVEDRKAPKSLQIDARFFKDESAPISPNRPGDDVLGNNHLWGALEQVEGQATAPGQGDGEGDGAQDNLQLHQRARITADTDNVTVRSKVGGELGLNGDTGKAYSKISGLTTKISSALSDDGWGEGNIESDGLQRSHVYVVVKNNPFLSDEHTLDESTAILTDGWSAGDQNMITDRVHGFVPTNKLEKVGNFIGKLKKVPLLWDLGGMDGAFGCVNLGVRPSKELKLDGLPKFEDAAGDHC